MTNISHKNRQQSDDKCHSYVACENCAMQSICLPIKTGQQPLKLTNQYLTKRVNAEQGSVLFHQGDALENIYAVCSGTYKLTLENRFSEEKIIGFRFPGELIGDDALYPKVHSHSAIALGEATVCKVNVAQLMAYTQTVPDLQLSLVELLTRQNYVSQQQFESFISKKSAESLVAAFLLNIAKRQSSKEEVLSVLKLAMSRDNIANFLGLRRETLSRVFAKLQKELIIEQTKKLVTVIDREQLCRLAFT